MKKVIIEPGCIGCRLCEELVPGVFKVNDISRVNKDVNLNAYTESIRQAVKACPVQVITCEE
jgi:ferredoxin